MITRPNFIAYNYLMWEYNQPFRRKYRIKSQHWNILSNIYYFDQFPPPGAVKVALLRLNPLHRADYIHIMLVDLESKGMIVHKRIGKEYTIHLLSHVTKDMDQLYNLDNVEGYIQSKLSKY